MSENEVKYTLSLKDLLSGKLRYIERDVNKFEGSITGLQTKLGGLGTALGIAFGGAMLVGFGAKIISAGTTVENAVTGLTTLLKDNAAAQAVVSETMEDATKMPFNFEGLLAARKALISAGVDADRSRVDVANLANAIAATGGGDDELGRMVINLQQIRNTGKATALDIKQFAYAGVNVYQLLADATGKPIEKIKDMEVSYEMLTLALKKAHDEGGIYANGLENMQKNVSVQLSNLGDEVFKLSAQMFEDLRPAITAIIGGLSKFIGLLKDGWEWLVRNGEVIRDVSIGIAIAAAGVGLYSLYTNAAAIGTAVLTAAQWALNVAMDANPIGIIIVGIGALIAAVIQAYNHFAKFRAVLWAVGAVVKEFVNIVVDYFMGLWHIIHGIFTLDADEIKLGGAQQVDAMFNAGNRLGKAAKDGYEAGLADFEAEKKAEEAAAATKAPTDKTKNKKAVGAIAPEMKSQTKGAQGQKAVTINVTIGSLIKDFKIQTTNISEGAAKVREQIAQALLSATNDSQILAQ